MLTGAGDVNRRMEKITVSFMRMSFVLHLERFGEMKNTYKIFYLKI